MKESDGNSNTKGKKDKLEDTANEEPEENEDNLITYQEYINATKALRSLQKRILPRTLSFRDVLDINKNETTYVLSDTNVDDFAMFRYEINSIFKLHMFEEEKDSHLMMGKNPLCKNRMGK